MAKDNTQITDATHHAWWVKAIAILLIVSITLLWIPFPITTTPVEQSVDSGVEVVDHLDGQNNFTPGTQHGQSTIQKLFTAFGK